MAFNKYSAIKQSLDGYSFASKLEANTYLHLKLLERAGEIKDIKCQVSVYLTEAKILYKPDFSVFDIALNEVVYIEAKGFVTPVWAIKKRLWKHYGPGRLRIYRQAYNDVTMDEEVIPK